MDEESLGQLLNAGDFYDMQLVFDEEPAPVRALHSATFASSGEREKLQLLHIDPGMAAPPGLEDVSQILQLHYN